MIRFCGASLCFGEWNVSQSELRAGSACIVDEDIDRSEGSNCFRYDISADLRIGAVTGRADHEGLFKALCDQVVHEVVELGLISPSQHDSRTFAQQLPGDKATN